MQETERRSALRARVAFALLFVFGLFLTGYVMWPFRVPLLLAAVLASVLHGVFLRVSRACGGRRWLGALLTTIGLLIVLVGPVAAAVTLSIQQAIKGLAFVHDQLGIHSLAQLKGNRVPLRAHPVAERALGTLHLTLGQVGALAAKASSWAEHAAQSLVTSSSTAIFHSVIMVIAFYFLLVEGQPLIRWLRRLSPLEARETEMLLDEFRSVARATILGAVIAGAFQAVAATIGYLIVGLPHVVFFGLLTLLASFVPVVGTPLIWLPAAVWLWVTGHHFGAIVLLAWCVVLVTGVEHVGKPFVLKSILQNRRPMHTGLVFLSLLGGIQMFGLIGLVLGPLVFAFFLAMVRMYEHRLSPVTTARH